LPDTPEATHSTKDAPAWALADWLAAVVATPGLTALRDLDEAQRVLLDDSMRGVELVARFEGLLVDVGSGGGAPGIPLAFAEPERAVVLLEAERRKCEFLERWAPPNARVVWGRAEEQGNEWAGVAVAKALAHPPTAVEWCLPLVQEGGAVILWVGPSVEPSRVAAVAARIAGELEDAPDGFLVVRKTGPTPEGFPRRVGVAKKRPLA
jgi:16S rRNA (guanine527-N7)-methyltransferase